MLAPEAVERILGREWAGRRKAVGGQVPSVEEQAAMGPDEAATRLAAWEAVIEPYLKAAAPPPLKTINARPLLFGA